MASDQLGRRVLCRQCSTELVAGPVEAPAERPAESQSISSIEALAEEELCPEPPPARTAPLPTLLAPGPEDEEPPKTWVRPPDRNTLSWVFFSGVFTFAWWPNALGQWLFLSIFSTIAALLGMQCQLGFAVGGEMGVVAAGCFALAAVMVGLFALSYAAACLVDIIVNTAYSNDKTADWPNSDWRERLLYLLRIGYLLVLAIVPAAAIAKLASWGSHSFGAFFAISIFVLFPILLLSALESDSIWALSTPIFRSLVTAWFGWVLFYFFAAFLVLGVTSAAVAAYLLIGRLYLVVACPIAAAGLFSYGRLLGRLGWLVLHREGQDKSLQEKYTASQNTTINEA